MVLGWPRPLPANQGRGQHSGGAGPAAFGDQARAGGAQKIVEKTGQCNDLSGHGRRGRKGAEPGCLPDNRFYLFCRDATERSYPPSTQEALTELGNLALLQGQPQAAQAAFEQAVALRPDNFQAPYERLAALCRQRGNLAGYLAGQARKAEVCANMLMADYAFRGGGMGMYLYYDPSQPGPLVLDKYLNLGGWWDNAARVRVVEVNELYKELADTYFYELGDYEPAGRYYKKYLAHLSRRWNKTPQQQASQLDASESQIRLAAEQGDYWQARNLAEKLLHTAPGNRTALLHLAHIRQRFA